MDAGEVERRFLRAIDHSDFLYLHNPYAYLGEMAAFELGYALADNKPTFATQAVTLENLEGMFDLYQTVSEHVTIATPAEAVASMRARETSGL
jgi:hypothetical protein